MDKRKISNGGNKFEAYKKDSASLAKPVVEQCRGTTSVTVIILWIVYLIWFDLALASELTDISLKAQKMRHEVLTKGQVIELLGPPTWVVLPGDTGHWALPGQHHPDGAQPPLIAAELIWKNGNCSPVRVRFDHENVVAWLDESRGLCSEGEWAHVPGEEYSCSRKERVKFCR
jgi:hypothetical protein